MVKSNSIRKKKNSSKEKSTKNFIGYTWEINGWEIKKERIHIKSFNSCSLYLQRRETLENSNYRLESLAVYRRIIKIVVIMHQLMSGGILEN